MQELFMVDVSVEESTLAAGSWPHPPSACQLHLPGSVMKDVLDSGCAHIPALNRHFLRRAWQRGPSS